MKQFQVDQMWEGIIRWAKHVSFLAIASVVVVVLSLVLFVFYDYVKRSYDVQKSELNSKLLWNNVGQCYFVQFDDFNKYYSIIRVQDCDKAK